MGSFITRSCSGDESFKNTSTHKGPKEHEDELTLSIVRELNTQHASSQHLKDGYKHGLEILTNNKLEGTIFENGLKKLMNEEEIQLFLYELEVHSGVDALYGIPLRIETARSTFFLFFLFNQKIEKKDVFFCHLLFFSLPPPKLRFLFLFGCFYLFFF